MIVTLRAFTVIEYSLWPRFHAAAADNYLDPMEEPFLFLPQLTRHYTVSRDLPQLSRPLRVCILSPRLLFSAFQDLAVFGEPLRRKRTNRVIGRC